VSAEFVAAMEDVLDVYEEPYDPRYPPVCCDETSKQRVAERRMPLPMKPSHPARYDYEYRRNGVCNRFLFGEPWQGWRHVVVTAPRTSQDFAHQMQWLGDEEYPDAKVIRMVMDNLNTHRPAALYETFPAAEARRIVKRLEFHYTPKHGSWLTMAETELSVFSRQYLDQRLPDVDTLKQLSNAIEEERNAVRAKIEWRFTSQDARVKLHHLYPSKLN
jgi:DDE superfamily endonuclease